MVELEAKRGVVKYSYVLGTKGSETLRDTLPVDNVPPCNDVVVSTVLIVEIICVFPKIESKNRDAMFG